jgi:outer membrane lipoprotein SlyB
MDTQVGTTGSKSGKFPEAVIWIAGVALTLFCGVGIAALMGWIPNSIGGAGETAVVGQQSATGASSVAPRAPRAAASHAAPVAHPAPEPVAAVAVCAECGVIESVREVDAKGKGSGVGAVGGAVVGGLLGNQMGAGHGKQAMTVLGAVGGAVAGNEVEKRVKTTKSYDITVRLNDGSSRVISEAGQPTWRIGDKVKVVNGAIQSNA